MGTNGTSLARQDMYDNDVYLLNPLYRPVTGGEQLTPVEVFMIDWPDPVCYSFQP